MMRIATILTLAMLAILPARADLVTFTISNSPQTGDIFTFPSDVIFDGTVTFNSSNGTCFPDYTTNCLDLNAIILDPSTTLPSFLTLDTGPFLDNIAGILSDDEFNTVSGEIFGITIAPNAQLGTYSGTVDILGALDDPDNVTNVLATADFTVEVVAPEPAAWGLAILGLAAITWVRRVAA